MNRESKRKMQRTGKKMQKRSKEELNEVARKFAEFVVHKFNLSNSQDINRNGDISLTVESSEWTEEDTNIPCGSLVALLAKSAFGKWCHAELVRVAEKDSGKLVVIFYDDPRNYNCTGSGFMRSITRSISRNELKSIGLDQMKSAYIRSIPK